jgi:hypothetical protein
MLDVVDDEIAVSSRGRPRITTARFDRTTFFPPSGLNPTVHKHLKMEYYMERSSMSGLIIAGAVLVLLGLIAIAVPVFTTQETKDVARVGDLKLQTTENKSFAVPPLVSGGAVVLGVLIIGAGFYQRR